MYNLIIVGAGGFGREVYQWAKDTFAKDRYQIKGFLSTNDRDLEGFRIDAPILGDEASYPIEANDRFLFAIGSVRIKMRVVQHLLQRGAVFETLIHPTAIVAETASIGQGVILCPYVIVSDHVVIGDYAMLNFYSSCGHDATVGKYAIMCPYAILNGHSVIEEGAYVGTHAFVAPGRRIGKGSQVSAGSAAMYSVSDNHFVSGVPGKSFRIYDNEPKEDQ